MIILFAYFFSLFLLSVLQCVVLYLFVFDIFVSKRSSPLLPLIELLSPVYQLHR